MKIAILEDDTSICDDMVQQLQSQGHTCTGFYSGKRLLAYLKRESYDLLLLDWGVPDMSGIELLSWVRSNLSTTLPVMFLTSRDDEADVEQALLAGADDYLVKPARTRELFARITAIQRRVYPEHPQKLLVTAPFVFDTVAQTALRDGEQLVLSPKEFDLALLLFRHLGRLLSRDYIAEAIWGREETPGSRTLDTHISKVRSKLALRPERGFLLKPVYSFGYRLERVAQEDIA